MSTKLTNQGESQVEEKSGSTKESWQKPESSVQPKPTAGKDAMTAITVADLLARIQDIQSQWIGADSMVMAEQNVILVALPIPSGLEIGKIIDGHGKGVYTVNQEPVVMAEGKEE